MKKIFGLVLFLGLVLCSRGVWARTEVTDWYIKNFKSEMVVGRDSTLLVKEKITADCGNLPGKHGIFRTLPTVLRTKDKTISMPIELVSITDFEGKDLVYSTQNDYSQKSVTWKIGDPNKTVTGENNYFITYKVENVISFDQTDIDELYWNLNGNFWDLETDSFAGKIVFPLEATKNNTKVNYYVGNLGSNSQEGVEYGWISDNVLQFKTKKPLSAGEGITASITFPKNIFIPYEPTFWEKYALFLWFIVPVAVFVVCFCLWKKYGKDPRIDKTIIAEFDVPEKLSPLELGTLFANGKVKTEFITASIVNLAVQKILQIEEVAGAGFFKLGQDYRLKVVDRDKVSSFSDPEKALFEELMGEKNEILLSSLKNNFQQSLSKIKKITQKSLEEKGLIEKTGLTFQIIFLVTGFLLVFLTFFLASWSFLSLPAMSLAVLVVFTFSFLMPKRTARGAETNWKIKGFKLYMETAEKYRSQFNEKENIFERFLPYAIMFGMTNLWIKKIKELYGEECFVSYHPVWFAGGALASFDVDGFASRVDGLSSAMAANISSGSGAGGGGFSGGGGGGGGGGGW